MNVRWTMSFIFSLMCACGAMAQSAGPGKVTLFPEKRVQVQGVRMSTLDFFPQIIASTGLEKPKRVGNVFRPPWARNVAGVGMTRLPGIQNYERGMAQGELWPAITATGWNPPDPTLAVGPNNVAVTANVDIAFFSKTGTQQFRQPIWQFFSGFGFTSANFIFDPKVMYDQQNGRFVVVALRQDGTISTVLYGISDTSNPNGTWHLYQFQALWTVGSPPNQTTYWLDYPGLGSNKDGYCITGNLFRLTGGGSGFGGVEFISVKKDAGLYSGTATLSYFRDTNAFGVQPARTRDNNVDRIFMASDYDNTRARIHSLTNIATTPVLNGVTITVPAFTYSSSDAPSPGGRTLDVLDGRYLNAEWRNGKLIASHAIWSGARVMSRWYQYNTNNYPAATPTLAQSGDVLSPTAGVAWFMPAVCSNELGDIAMVFTESSSAIVANFKAGGRRLGDAPGTFGTPVLLQSSVGATYGGAGFNRWGDYFMIETDPNDDTTFYGIGMVGNNGSWLTIVHPFTISTPIACNSLTLDASSVIGGNSTTGHVNMSAALPSGGWIPGGYVVTLSSNNGAATVPSTVTVPEGANTAAFTINTSAVANDVAATITATFRGVQRTANLNVLWANKIVPPTAFSFLGLRVAGNLASLAAQDGDRLKLQIALAADTWPPILLAVNAASPIPSGSTSKLEFIVTHRTSHATRAMRIYLFDWVANAYVQMQAMGAPTAETTSTVTLTTNLNRYIQAGTNALRAKVEVDDATSSRALNWFTEFDQAVWKVYR